MSKETFLDRSKGVRRLTVLFYLLLIRTGTATRNIAQTDQEGACRFPSVVGRGGLFHRYHSLAMISDEHNLIATVRKTQQKRRMIGPASGEANVNHLLIKLWRDDEGQDIAEYAVMLAVILVLVVGTIRLVGSNANNAFSSVASSLQ
jgi:Flp pilus assembly pilin Flp